MELITEPPSFSRRIAHRAFFGGVNHHLLMAAGTTLANHRHIWFLGFIL
jgi:hypothetical protein